MALKTACPSCNAQYRLPEDREGKRVKCAQCGEKFVASPLEEEADGGAITAAPRVKAAGPPALPKKSRAAEESAEDRPKRRPRAEEEDEDRPRRKRRDDDEEDEAPKRRRREEADEAEDERPRRRRRGEEDEDEDRPRKKKKVKEATANVPLVIGCMAGVVLLMGGTSAAVVIWSIKNPNPDNIFNRVAAAADNAKNFQAQLENMQNHFFDPAVPLDTKGPAVEVKLPANGGYQHNNQLAANDPKVNNKHYKVYAAALEKGKLYQIEMSSGEFDPYLCVLAADGKILAQHDDIKPLEDLNARVIFSPAETGKYRILATSFDFEGEPGDQGPFTLKIGPAPAGSIPTPSAPPMAAPALGGPAVGPGGRRGRGFQGGMPLLAVAGKGTMVALGGDGSYTNTSSLGRADPKLNGKSYKVYSIPMEQGKSYQIDLASNDFDAFLFLLGPGGQTLRLDDDGGDNTNARISYQAAAAGTYRVVATSLTPDETGNFTFSVRRQ